MSREPKHKTLEVNGKSLDVEYRDLFGKEPLDIQERATRFDPHTKEMAIDTAVLVWERLKARVLKINGEDPDWDNMAESTLWELAKEFGPPDTAPLG